MATELPRPAVGACVRVLPTLTRTFFDRDRPPEPDSHAGECGIVIGYDVPAPTFARDRSRILGETSWDLRVVFLFGAGSAYDMDEVEITHGSPWPDDEG